MKKRYFDTPMVDNPSGLSDEEKKKLIQHHFSEIMRLLELDLEDDSLKDTPKRVAKMYIDEIFSGLSPKNEPKASTFENKYKYNEMLVEKNITLYSTCEHHFLPIVGQVHIAYISMGKVIGLSKINRIVEYYAQRPQVQERLTIQITRKLQEVLDTKDVACIVDAKHLCVNARGIKHTDSSTVTAEYGGRFGKEIALREELYTYLKLAPIKMI